MATNEQKKAEAALVDAFGQHKSYLYRLSTAAASELTSEADKVALALWRQLGEMLDGLSDAEKASFSAGKYNTPELREMRDAITAATSQIGAVVAAGFAVGAASLAAYETGYAATAVSKMMDVKPASISSEKMLKQALNSPLAGGRLVHEMLDSIAPDTKDKILLAIRAGIASDNSNSQIIRALRGTKALEYQDGIMQATKVEIERVVRTARNHVSGVVYEETYEALGVQYVIRSATLEGRTCMVCASLDGKVYKIGQPRPPATLHYNCRCQYIPSMTGELMGERPFSISLKVKGRDGESTFRSVGDMTKKQRENADLKQGRVKADTSFSTFFARQDEAFKQQWLGPSRYKLYTEGKLSLDRFVDPQNKMYTLDELRLRDAETFRALFGE